MPGQLFVISAPSGTGKTTVIRKVQAQMDGLGYSISHTSRKPRPGEREGVDYYFVGPQDFEEMIKQGAFVEWARVYGDYYGTSVVSLHDQLNKGMDVILDVDPVGARNIKKQFPDAALIFIIPPSLDVLEQRLYGRGTDSEATIKKRLEKAVSEVQEALGYDYIVINEELEAAVQEVIAIIRAERCRVKRRQHFIKECFPLS
ncbi:MAG: guanylate kinase [Deltaproteobacteria bacterium]|nr:MAG: guanylate kinase [Deltaproteobacteria bacterium]